MSPAFALVDCNNFYASCQKMFRPDLKHKPVVVLSNNDGCVVARSKEAKQLGIKMGTPVFKLREEILLHGIVCFSSNYPLYADMSNRVMTLLEEEAPSMEIYSIDEAFLDVTGIDNVVDFELFGKRVKHKIDKHTGIPVCVGIAPTKTLAKLANNAAKKYNKTQGVVNLMDRARQQKLLALIEVDDVWGVGRRLSERLHSQNIHTALDLANANPKSIRQHYSVVLERTVQELNGVSCLDLECVRPIKQQIICSRSFGHRITDKQELREAISKYTARASIKLRGENRLCRVITIFIRTSPYANDEPQYSNSMSAELPYPTDDTRDLLEVADVLFQRLWRHGFRYMKGGVIFADFYEHGAFQKDLFQPDNTKPNAKALMSIMDTINRSGLGNISFAAQGVTPQWSMKQDYLSPAYTTRWNELLVVN